MEKINPFKQSMTGLEIKDWVWYHSNNRTNFTSIAKHMMPCFNLNNDKIYMVTLCDGMPTVTEVSEKGRCYEIPCNDSKRS